MTTQTVQQARELLRGQNYHEGERIIDPITRKESFIFDENTSELVLITASSDEIGSSTYDYSGGKDWENVPPQLLSYRLVQPLDKDFQVYNHFIKTHGGAQ